MQLRLLVHHIVRLSAEVLAPAFVVQGSAQLLASAHGVHASTLHVHKCLHMCTPVCVCVHEHVRLRPVETSSEPVFRSR
eukprot:6672210-Alexandrium_andersonii.AAC.1